MNTSTLIYIALNSRVDFWNKEIQKLNPAPTLHALYSKDTLCEVDDPNEILKSFLTEEVLNRFDSNKAPPHKLELKVGDICYLYRTICKSDGLATNTRVKILRIEANCIQIQTLSQHPINFVLPRIRFKFALPWGQSYQIMRTQFPLRLAYALSVNKSQGQGFEKLVFDITSQPFQHGHTYVATSRVYDYRTIAILCNEDSLSADRKSAIVDNVVYEGLIDPILGT